MIKVQRDILVFFLVIVGLFVLISQMIPQIAAYPQKPLSPEEFAQLSPEQMIAKGKDIFGTGGVRCSQCHQIEGAPGRCPNLGGVGARAVTAATQRTAATGQKYTPEMYLLESLIKPGAFVVKGYSNIMPAVYQPPLDFSEEDIKAVVAYLQSLGGAVTMSAGSKLPEEWHNEIASSKKAAKDPVTGNIANGKDIFYNRMRCMACHKTTVDGKAVGGVLGPDLSRVGEIRGAQSLKDIVTSPPGDIMPKHFRENLTDQELNDLVVFLMNLRG